MSTQLRELIKIFKSRTMQKLNIFGAGRASILNLQIWAESGTVEGFLPLSIPPPTLLHPPSLATNERPPSCPTGPNEMPHHCAPPAPRTCPRCRLTKPGNRSSLPSSSSVSNPPAAASSGYSPTPPRVPRCQGAPPNHFSGRLNHSSNPSSVPPPRRCLPP
jgi:hypothetical protein